MIQLSLGQIAQIVGGYVDGADPQRRVTGAAFLDSREVEPGGIFVALAGEHHDGHDFGAAAVAAGAAVVLGSRPTGVATIVVEDVTAALQSLAAFVLARLRAFNSGLSVLAITGSHGKTTVKDMLATILSKAGPTVATYGSFNNELGLPLTVLRATPATQFLVLEMGARGVGHIAHLTQIAPPDVGVVLNIGTAHIGEFGSLKATAAAKGELVEALPESGWAVLNADDEAVLQMRSRTKARVISWGTQPGVDLQLTHIELVDDGTVTGTVVCAGQSHPLHLRVLGRHQASNAAAALSAAIAVGVPLTEAVPALEQLEQLSRWRMQPETRRDGLLIINDAYNANPASMEAAIATLGELGERTGRRTVAVVGAMLELGAEEAPAHQKVGTVLTHYGISTVVAVGHAAKPITDTRPDAVWFPTAAAAAQWVRTYIDPTDIVLVKASRSVGLESVAQALLEEVDQ